MVLPFRNLENFAKYQVFYFETGCYVIIKTILWLTEGEKELKLRLNTAKKKSFNKDEKEKLKKYLGGISDFYTLDLTFYFKIYEFLIASNIIWTKSCPKHIQDELHKLLVDLKNGRNELAHPNDDHKNLTELQVKGKCDEMKDLLTNILEKAGEKAKNVSESDIQTEVKEAKSRLERIKEDKNIDKSLEPYVKTEILKDLKEIYKKELESSFQNELKGYSIPYLKKQDGPENSRLSGIHFSSPVNVILGEAGAGKTALTKFLFHSWLTEKTESLEELTEFDFVLRIQCNNIRSTDLNQFYETKFPNAAYYFSKTSTLARHFKDLKVLWIMDGFDESTAEYNGFMESFMDYYSQLHKFIITTRLHTSQILRKYFSEIVSFNLEKLLDDNIKEILEHRINDKEQRDSFMEDYCHLNNVEKEMLKIPIIFVLYTELWKESPGRITPPFTLIKLYKEITNNKLKLLKEKLAPRSSIIFEKYLGLSIENWFYGSLCKLSFQKIIVGDFNMKCSEVEVLVKDTIKGHLIPPDCMSLFLAYDLTENVYNFTHASQQYFYAALYMKNLHEYPNFDMKKNAPKEINFAIEELMKYYIEMIVEDDYINEFAEQALLPVHKLLSEFTEYEQAYLCYQISILSKFNEKFTQKVSGILENCLYIGRQIIFYSPSMLKKYLSFINPKKIVINTIIYLNDYYWGHNSMSTNESMEDLLQFLNNLKIGETQIEFIPSFSENEKQHVKAQIENRCKKLFYSEAVSCVIIQALRWLCKGPEPLEKHLVDLAEKDKSCLSSRDIYLLKELAEGNCKIKELDLTLLLELARIILEMEPTDDSNWTKWHLCGNEIIDLGKLIEDFAKLPHACIKKVKKDIHMMNERKTQYNLLGDDFMENSENIKYHLLSAFVIHSCFDNGYLVKEELDKEICDHLSLLIRTAGQCAKIEDTKIEDVLAEIINNVEHLSSIEQIDNLSNINAKQMIIEDLKKQFKEQQKLNPEYEHEFYAIPSLLIENGTGRSISLKNIFTFDEWQFLVVRGASGSGKSMLSRFLYASWVKGNINSVNELSSFDIVVRVDGRMCNDYLPELLENLFPEACNSMPTIDNLMNNFLKLKTLWIWEVFNEYGSQKLDCLIGSLILNIPKCHRLLFTCRDQPFLSYGIEYSRWRYLKLEGLSNSNTNEIIEARITNVHDRKSFKSIFEAFDDTAKASLSNPFNLTVFIEYWLSYPNKIQNTVFSNARILSFKTDLQLNCLKERYLSCSSDESKQNIDNWLYGSLCKQSFLMICSTELLIKRNVQEILINEAINEKLDPKLCMSSFFKQVQSQDGHVAYDFIHNLQPFVLGAYFLMRWKEYPPFPENELKKSLFQNVLELLDCYVKINIDRLNDQKTLDTTSKIASAFNREDECYIWCKISSRNNFNESIINFVASFVDRLEPYHIIPNSFASINFLKYVSPKRLNFGSVYIAKSKKDEFKKILDILQVKKTEIFVGTVYKHTEFTNKDDIDKFLDLLNETDLNVSKFEGTADDLFELENHFHKLKTVNLRVNSFESYRTLCQSLSRMNQLIEIVLSFKEFELINDEKYPAELLSKTTLVCHNPEKLQEFLEFVRYIKVQDSPKFRSLFLKKWWITFNRDEEGHPYPTLDWIKSFDSTINEFFSMTEKEPKLEYFYLKNSLDFLNQFYY